MPSSYTLGDHFETFIKEQVEGGRYASASEVIRDGLRLLEEEEQRRQAVLDGLDLEEIGDCIALDNPKRAVSFIREIRQHCEKIADGPRRYVARPD